MRYVSACAVCECVCACAVCVCVCGMCVRVQYVCEDLHHLATHILYALTYRTVVLLINRFESHHSDIFCPPPV